MAFINPGGPRQGPPLMQPGGPMMRPPMRVDNGINPRPIRAPIRAQTGQLGRQQRSQAIMQLAARLAQGSAR